MSKEEIKKSNRIFIASLWIIPIVFYLAFWALDGAVWCADSDSYVRMHDCREPLYPTLLAGLRYIMGVGPEADPENNLSLTVMAFMQSILAGIATSSLTTFLVRMFLKESLLGDSIRGRKMFTSAGKATCIKYGRKQRVVAYILLVIPLCVSLINRFIAGRSSMYSNSIMTEGITISLYMLAFRYILEYMIQGTGYSFGMSCIIVLIGICTRKQMYVLLCLLLIALIYRKVALASKMKRIKGILVTVLTVALILGMNVLFDCSYNLVVKDTFTMHTEDNRFVTTMAMYTSEREFVEHIEPELKDLYLRIYDECNSHKWLMHDAPTTWRGAVSHFAGNYDHIQLDTMQLMLEDYVENNNYHGFKEGMLKTEKIDVIRSSFNRVLIPLETERLLKVFVFNLLNGLVDTVARDQLVFCVYAIFIYVIFLGFAVADVVKYRRITKDDNYDLPGDPEYLTSRHRALNILSIMTLLSILGNVTLVSLVIFCQVRYTIYNMPLFYMTLIILIYGYLVDSRGKYAV